MQKELIILLIVRLLYPKNTTRSLDNMIMGYLIPYNFSCTCRIHKIIHTLT
jgi:hypothetical protein